MTCGVKIIATLHASSINDLKNKEVFKRVYEQKMFQRIIVLSKENGVGTIQGVYQENLSKIYGGVV